MSSDGGKGSAPRKERDDDAFRKNWEAIFGKKKDPEHCENKGKCAHPFCSCGGKKDEADTRRNPTAFRIGWLDLLTLRRY